MNKSRLEEIREWAEIEGYDGEKYIKELLSFIYTLQAEVERLSKERDEFEYKLGCLLCHVTKNKYSKTNYSLENMYEMADDSLASGEKENG